ncbi:MAG: porin [Paracoccaceae bacterium]
MKKVLFATTALVFSAGIAAAEVTISGSANAGFKYSEYDFAPGAGITGYAGKSAAGWYEIDMDVIGTTETDSGLTFGARIQLDTDYASAKKGTEGLKGNVFVSGAFGTFSVGTGLFPMADDSGLTDIGFDGIGIDNVAEAAMYTGSADARWDYTVGALTLGVSLNTIEEDYGVKVGYDFGQFGVLVAFDHDEELTSYSLDGISVGVPAMENDSASIKLNGNFGAVKGEVFYASSDVIDDSYGVYAAYTAGALTLEAAYSKVKNNGFSEDAYGVGAKYDLGGATLAGGVGKNVFDDTVADLGVSFKF